jgi:hypothetical protein
MFKQEKPVSIQSTVDAAPCDRGERHSIGEDR